MLTWKLKKTKILNNSYNKFFWNFYFLNFITYSFQIKNHFNIILILYKNMYIWSRIFLHNKLKSNKILLNNYKHMFEFKTLYKFNLLKKTEIWTYNKPLSLKQLNFKDFSSKIIRFLYIYLILNKNLAISTYKSNRSYKTYYFYHSKYGIHITSFTNLIKIWKKMYLLLYNLFYYDINTLLFGSTPYKKEVLAFNLNLNRFILKYLNFFNLYFTVEKFKISTVYKYMFYKLNDEGIKTAIVLDTYHHQNALYYLGKYYFFSIGLAPTTQNIHKTNFSVPIFLNTLINQLFFYRLILVIKKNSTKDKYLKKKNYWTILT